MHGIKLCMSLTSTYRMPYEDQIRTLRQIGFDAFFSCWEARSDVVSLRKIADEENMIYQSIHAPYGRLNRLWDPTDETPSVIEELIHCLRACADNAVPIMVLHPFIGFTKHNPTPEGLDNYAIIVREAEKLGVKIALENVEGEEYLAALMAHFKSCATVGFCWDTGHEMCYNRSQDMLALYGDRLLATHLNDNLGIHSFDGTITFLDDLHLLPFDGVGDWNGIVDRLNRLSYDGILTFELNNQSKPNRHENDAYQRMDPVEFLTNAYIRACRVATLKEQRKGL